MAFASLFAIISPRRRTLPLQRQTVQSAHTTSNSFENLSLQVTHHSVDLSPLTSQFLPSLLTPLLHVRLAAVYSNEFALQ